jgi:hypothetical protein
LRCRKFRWVRSWAQNRHGAGFPAGAAARKRRTLESHPKEVRDLADSFQKTGGRLSAHSLRARPQCGLHVLHSYGQFAVCTGPRTHSVSGFVCQNPRGGLCPCAEPRCLRAIIALTTSIATSRFSAFARLQECLPPSPISERVNPPAVRQRSPCRRWAMWQARRV